MGNITKPPRHINLPIQLHLLPQLIFNFFLPLLKGRAAKLRLKPQNLKPFPPHLNTLHSGRRHKPMATHRTVLVCELEMGEFQHRLVEHFGHLTMGAVVIVQQVQIGEELVI